MNKVYNVVQTSICDGEILVNVTPCADLHSAQAIMNEEIRTLLSEGKYDGLDLDEIERDQNDDEADCDYILECMEHTLYLCMWYDDYSELIKIDEKEFFKIC